MYTYFVYLCIPPSLPRCLSKIKNLKRLPHRKFLFLFTSKCIGMSKYLKKYYNNSRSSKYTGLRYLHTCAYNNMFRCTYT